MVDIAGRLTNCVYRGSESAWIAGDLADDKGSRTGAAALSRDRREQRSSPVLHGPQMVSVLGISSSIRWVIGLRFR